MRTLSDIGNLYLSDLCEGVLDDIETNINTGTDIMHNATIEKWCVGGKCRIVKKKNGYKLVGDFKLAGQDITTYSGPKIIAVDGNFSICNTNLTSLEGIFDPNNTEITGTFTIEDNPKLVSLKGSPLQVGTLTITGNTSLKDIDIAPHVMRNAYISKNGKKFSKEQLAGKIQVYKHIFCSMDDEEVIDESLICEAFKAPQLKLIADAIKKATNSNRDRDSRFKLSDVLTIEWDKIDASQICELDTDDPKCAKLARLFISNKIGGIMAVMDKDGDVMFLVKNKRIYKIHEKYRIPRWGRGIDLDKWNAHQDLTTTDILDAIANYDSVMFIAIDILNAYNAWSKLRVARNTAQNGALALNRGIERTGKDTYGERIDKDNVRYYQQIADENRRRYKKMLIEIKSKRATMSNNFTQIKTRLDRAFDRYTTLLAKILQNPTKYDTFDIDWLNDQFATISVKDRWSYTERGLFKQVEEYMQYVIRGAKGELYNANNIENNLKVLEDNINKSLNSVEARLTELEAK